MAKLPKYTLTHNEKKERWELVVNRRGPFTPDRRAREPPVAGGVERVGDRSCGA